MWDFGQPQEKVGLERKFFLADEKFWYMFFEYQNESLRYRNFQGKKKNKQKLKKQTQKIKQTKK